MRTALFWVITQRVVSNFTPEDGIDRLSRNFGKKLALYSLRYNPEELIS